MASVYQSPLALLHDCFEKVVKTLDFNMYFPSKFSFFAQICICILSLSGFEETGSVSVEKDLALTQSEKSVLDKFRKKVEPLLYRNFMKYDIYLIRWLRARDFDVPSAEAMLRTHLKWRKERKMDSILQEDLDDIKKDFHATIDTYDREGRPSKRLEPEI